MGIPTQADEDGVVRGWGNVFDVAKESIIDNLPQIETPFFRTKFEEPDIEEYIGRVREHERLHQFLECEEKHTDNKERDPLKIFQQDRNGKATNAAVTPEDNDLRGWREELQTVGEENWEFYPDDDMNNPQGQFLGPIRHDDYYLSGCHDTYSEVMLGSYAAHKGAQFELTTLGIILLTMVSWSFKNYIWKIITQKSIEDGKKVIDKMKGKK